jgi:hypothetical protein
MAASPELATAFMTGRSSERECAEDTGSASRTVTLLDFEEPVPAARGPDLGEGPRRNSV